MVCCTVSSLRFWSLAAGRVLESCLEWAGTMASKNGYSRPSPLSLSFSPQFLRFGLIPDYPKPLGRIFARFGQHGSSSTNAPATRELAEMDLDARRSARAIRHLRQVRRQREFRKCVPGDTDRDDFVTSVSGNGVQPIETLDNNNGLISRRFNRCHPSRWVDSEHTIPNPIAAVRPRPRHLAQSQSLAVRAALAPLQHQ